MQCQGWRKKVASIGIRRTLLDHIIGKTPLSSLTRCWQQQLLTDTSWIATVTENHSGNMDARTENLFHDAHSWLDEIERFHSNNKDSRSAFHLLKLILEDLENVCRSETNGSVHPARSAQVQTEVVRAHRGKNHSGRRKNSPPRSQLTR